MDFLNQTLLYQRRSFHAVHPKNQPVDLQKTADFTPLGGSEIDLWVARLNLSSIPMRELEEILSPEEKERAQKFHFERDKFRSILSRGILRLILSKYLNQSPDQIKIIAGPQGKPCLFQPDENHSLQFNLSHSHETILYGITRIGEIGVDVEKVREIPDLEKIIGQFFSQGERAAFDELPPAQKELAFFTCWCRKEAFMKARGGGFSLPLDQFDVSIHPDQPAALLSTRWDPLEVDHWSLSDIRLDENYVAAMAVKTFSLER